jgi:hypothetical protein
MLQRKTARAIARHEFYEDEGTAVLLPVGTAETALEKGGFAFNTHSALYLTFGQANLESSPLIPLRPNSLMKSNRSKNSILTNVKYFAIMW